MKKVLIPFSGGLDSTYLVWKNLVEGNNVTVVYFELENNSEKTRLEKISREKTYDILKEEYGERLNKSYFSYKIHLNNIQNDFSLAQPPIWILGCFFSCNEFFDEIQLAYVMNDDVVSFIKDIEVLYKAYEPFSNRPLPLLSFPLLKDKKEHFIKELPEEFYKLIYSCENPSIKEEGSFILFKPCEDQCEPCRRQQRMESSRFKEQIFSEKIYDITTNEFDIFKDVSKRSF